MNGGIERRTDSPMRSEGRIMRPPRGLHLESAPDLFFRLAYPIQLELLKLTCRWKSPCHYINQVCIIMIAVRRVLRTLLLC